MLKKLTDRVYYLPHDFKGEDRPILGLIKGDYSSLMIDAGISPSHAKDFLKEAEGIDYPPIEQVVITHNHYDHIFGMNYLKIPSIAHQKTGEIMKEMQNETWDNAYLKACVKSGKMSKAMVGYITHEMPDESERVFCDIDATFDNRLEIDLGNLILYIDHIECDHTDDSSVVYVPSEKIVFIGDCIYPGMIGQAYGYSLDKVNKMIKQLEEYDAKWYMVSHEDIYSRQKLMNLLSNIQMVGETVENMTNEKEALERFSKVINRQPTDEERFFVGRFVAVNIEKEGM